MRSDLHHLHSDMHTLLGGRDRSGVTANTVGGIGDSPISCVRENVISDVDQGLSAKCFAKAFVGFFWIRAG